MTLFAAAPLVVVPDLAGILRYCYQGKPLPEVTDSVAQRLLAEGMVVRQLDAPAEAGLAPPVPVPPAPPAAGAAERPANTAPKPDWVAFAAASGIDPAEAEAMSKADLIKL